MPDARPVVLHDVKAACSHLTELGRDVIPKAVAPIANRLVILAALQGWSILRHEEYSAWVHRTLPPDILWLVLDPLLTLEPDCGPSLTVRASRVATAAGWKIDTSLPEKITEAISGRTVGLIDDVASSGGTLKWIAARVAECGGRLRAVRVGIARDEARTALMSEVHGVDWRSMVSGDCDGVHLRDACPFVPFSGRRLLDFGPIPTPSGRVDLRVPLMAFRGGPWQILNADRGIQMATVEARRQVVGQLARALGRAPTVADVPMLGAFATVTVPKPRRLSATTPLAEFLC